MSVIDILLCVVQVYIGKKTGTSNKGELTAMVNVELSTHLCTNLAPATRTGPLPSSDSFRIAPRHRDHRFFQSLLAAYFLYSPRRFLFVLSFFFLRFFLFFRIFRIFEILLIDCIIYKIKSFIGNIVIGFGLLQLISNIETNLICKNIGSFIKLWIIFFY